MSQVSADDRPALWFTVPRPRENPSVRLFCFPYAGGSSTDPVFRQWAQEMPADVEVAVLEMPGRSRRMAEPFETSLMQLVRRLVPVFAQCIDRPFAFFGHSLGAIVAYEVARALAQAGMPVPSLLVVSAKQAPHMPYRRRLFDLPRDEFISALRELNGTRDEILENEELLDIVVSVLRNDLEMAFNYRFSGQPLRTVPILACAGQDDPHVELDSVLAWREHAEHFGSSVYPGGHFYIQHDSGDAIRTRMVAVMSALAHGRGNLPALLRAA